MSFLYFEDNEIGDICDVIHHLQIRFDPTYALEGKFSVKDSFALQGEDNDV